MGQRARLFERLKSSITALEPDATVVLFGSFARGEERPESDVDLLILVDKTAVTRDDAKRITYPLYDIEFETGQIISPIVLSRRDWESRYSITPFYERVRREGIVL